MLQGNAAPRNAIMHVGKLPVFCKTQNGKVQKAKVRAA